MERDRALLAIGRVLVSVFVGACFAATAGNDWVLGVLTFGVVFVTTLVLTQKVVEGIHDH